MKKTAEDLKDMCMKNAGKSQKLWDLLNMAKGLKNPKDGRTFSPWMR